MSDRDVLAETLNATYQGADGQGWRLVLMAEDGAVIPPPLPESLVEAIRAALRADLGKQPDDLTRAGG